jgi:hypothetical protein
VQSAEATERKGVVIAGCAEERRKTRHPRGICMSIKGKELLEEAFARETKEMI